MRKLQWNNLVLKIRKSETVSAFKRSILKSVRRSSTHIPNRIKFITRLRLAFSHLREHRFRQNLRIFLIQFTVLGWYRDYYSLPVHYMVHCPNYLDERRTFLDKCQNIGENIYDKIDFQISEFLLFGVSSNNDASNTCVLNAIIQYTLATKRFESWVVWKIHIC